MIPLQNAVKKTAQNQRAGTPRTLRSARFSGHM